MAGATISVRIKGGNPFVGIGVRAKDLKPFFKIVGKAFFDDPDVYTRPDRKRGDTTVEKHGRPINWVGKYAKRNTRVSLLKKSIKISSSVPYHPQLTSTAVDNLTERMTRWLITDGS